MTAPAASPGVASRMTRYWFDLGEDRRDDALPEGVVERVVDRRRGDAEAAGRGAVDEDISRQPVLAEIGRDVGDLGDLLQPRDQLRNPGGELVRIRVLQRELVLGAADRGVDGQVLHRLHVEIDAGDILHLALQPADDRAGVERALVARLQIDEEAAGIERRIGAVDADERRQADDIGILEDRVGERRLGAPPSSRTRPRPVPRKSPGSARCPEPERTPSGSRRRETPSGTASRPRPAASAPGGRAPS